jgi:hypothetical protein
VLVDEGVNGLHVTDEEEDEVEEWGNVHTEDASAYGYCQLLLEFA